MPLSTALPSPDWAGLLSVPKKKGKATKRPKTRKNMMQIISPDTVPPRTNGYMSKMASDE